ncbi:MAG TPA: hypothetical protein PKK43_16695 [Spirochaetota bacterium]|nr:hypothetical protein [Spirochaetota bacterium]
MKGKFKLLSMLAPGFLLVLITGAQGATVKESSFLLKEELIPGIVKMLPVPVDFRNYFVLQAIDSSTSILIGDFSGSEKMISLSVDKNQDGKEDSVSEYFPDSKKSTKPSVPSTPLYTSFDQTRTDIINGKIFANNYSYRMFSLNTLKERLKLGKDIYGWSYGYNVKIYDPDNPSTIMGEYFFSKKNGLYTLIFATYYFKLYKTRVTPPLYYSVFCKDTKDPKIVQVVEELYKLVPAQ